jgi:ribonuclease I
MYVLDNTVVNDSGQYENCYAGTQDVPSTLSPALQASLRCLWLNKTGSDEALWTNQWRKYGSCTGLTIEAYFQLAVDKFTQYDANVSFSFYTSFIASVPSMQSLTQRHSSFILTCRK